MLVPYYSTLTGFKNDTRLRSGAKCGGKGMGIEGPLATGAPLNLPPLQKKKNEVMGPTRSRARERGWLPQAESVINLDFH